MRLIHGDCLEILKTLPDGCVDAVVTDPPYGIDYQSAWRTDSERHHRIANDKQPFVWWLYDAARVIKPGGCLLCFCRWDVAEAFRLAIKWAGLHVGAQLVWDRGIHGLGDPPSRPAPQHDLVWFAVNGSYRLPNDRPKSVVRCQRILGGDLLHPNQKPEALMRELTCDYVPDDGTVLDPFMGSGTTGVACVREGRDFIGIEINANYFDIAKRRIEEAESHRDGTAGELFAFVQGELGEPCKNTAQV